MEKYIIINEFDNYAISNLGNIKNVKNSTLLSPYLSNNGYLTYTFCQNGIKKTFEIHRLVALHFIDNPNNKPYVRHLDGDKTNNKAENLEWCSEIFITSKDKTKPILAKNIDTNETMSFKSITEAGAILGINKNTIIKVLKGKRNHVHRYSFYFI